MRHEYRLTGETHRIRPVVEPDAALIVRLRSGEHARFLHRIDGSEQAQRRYIEQYLRTPGEYYFVVERVFDGRPEGLTALVDVDHDTRSAQWGRTILRPCSLAAPDMVLLILQLAFDVFGLDHVWGWSFAENARMMMFSKALGFEHQATSVMVDGALRQGFKAVLTRERWQDREPDLRAAARTVARLSRSMQPAVCRE
jgi:RimJ/RimL family protein N-acetyltransferase